MKQSGSAVRVLVVEEEGLGQPTLDGILGPATELVRARSLREARELFQSQSFDVVVTDATQLRGVLDALFAFVGLFSLGGVVLDVNHAPLAASGLPRGNQVVGHRFVDMPWFAHSSDERARISAAIAAAARGESIRLETRIRSTRGVWMWIDASFRPLRDKGGVVTHVVGSGVDITGALPGGAGPRRPPNRSSPTRSGWPTSAAGSGTSGTIRVPGRTSSTRSTASTPADFDPPV